MSRDGIGDYDSMTTSQPRDIKPSNAVTRLVSAAQFLLIGLALYFLARASLAFFAPESLWDAPPVTHVASEQIQSASRARLDLSFDPFHRTQIVQDEVFEIGTDAPETTLNLKLFGRRVGPNGSAVLETSGGGQKTYSIGDEIISGVILKAVNPGYIVLSQGGRIERLTFDRESETSLLESASESKAETSLIIPNSDPSPTTQATFTSDMKAVPKSFDMNAFLSGVNFTPALNNGKLAGYKITPKTGFIDLSDIGLSSGDIITKIGGIDLASPTLNPASIPAQLSGKSTIPLTLIRGGKTVSLTLGT